MQGRNFLFEPSNLKRQTPMNLFEKSDFKPLRVSNVRTIPLPQFKLPDRQQLDENSKNLATPPMEKKFVPTPQAPIKNKARSRKVDLKPKKLQYSEDELGAQSNPDSGLCVRFDQSSDSLPDKQNTVNCKKRDPPQKPTRILRSRLNKIKIQTDDKENDRNVIRNASNTRNNVAQTSVAFYSNAEKLSQCNSDLDWKERLRWLQARRNIGVWIECCNKKCMKWRYTEDYHDPSDVPELWYCAMNSDKSIALCSIPQCPISPGIQIDLIENAYNAGSIVWAHITGFPWWPGVISDCPDTFAYYELARNSLKPSKYHVVFIQEKFEYAWVKTKDIKPFKSITYKELVKKTKYCGVDYKDSLTRACELAASALKLSISDRLEKFSYLAQYEKLNGEAVNTDANNNKANITDVAVVQDVSAMDTVYSSDVEMISPSPTSLPNPNHISLKNFYYNVVGSHTQKQLDRCSATMNQY